MVRRNVVIGIKLLLGILLYALAAHFCHLVQSDMRYTHIVLDSSITAVDAAAIERQEAEEENPLGFCFWGEAPLQTVHCRETGGLAQVTPMLLFGDTALMGAEALTWQDGCLVDEETAQRLFGTKNCGGQRLWYNGVSYPVLGTVSSMRPIMIKKAEAEDQLERLIMPLLAEDGKSQGQQYLLRWGLQGTVIDFFSLWSFSNALLLLFPGTLLWKLCRWIGKKNRLVSLLAAAVGLWLLGRWLVIPTDMIPTRWSDFSFWGRWWTAEKENLIRILFMAPGEGQLQMLLNVVKSIKASTFAALAVLWPVSGGS